MDYGRLSCGSGKSNVGVRQMGIGFDFVGAEDVFNSFQITREDTRGEYGEQRFQTLGLYGNVVVVSWPRFWISWRVDQC